MNGYQKKRTLTGAEASQIEQLTAICNTYEGLHMRLDLDMLRKRHGNTTNDFLYYEDGTLVGYLNVDTWGTKEKELIGMVHPNYRRRTIFRTLLSAAKDEWLDKGVQRFILICEHTSRSGLAFVQAIGAHHDFSEHEMVLGTFRQRQSFDQRVHTRKANANDFEALVSIIATDMGDEERAKRFVARYFQEHKRPFYIGMLGEETVGCLNLDEMEHEIGIYGFVVRPEYRGRGYGRQILEDVIRTIRSESPKGIMLDVETDNTNAVGLYLSCGFEIRTTYDYYGLDLH
jgi:ribosomal protein S18 acetylase RimI-like enzyme